MSSHLTARENMDAKFHVLTTNNAQGLRVREHRKRRQHTKDKDGCFQCKQKRVKVCLHRVFNIVTSTMGITVLMKGSCSVTNAGQFVCDAPGTTENASSQDLPRPLAAKDHPLNMKWALRTRAQARTGTARTRTRPIRLSASRRRTPPMLGYWRELWPTTTSKA
jgi:hypothetical protein